MSGTEIETTFTVVLTKLVAVLQQGETGPEPDVAGAMQLLAEVKPRTVIAFSSDLKRWLSWWQERGQQPGGSLHQSIQAHLDFLIEGGINPKTAIRHWYSIKRVLAALGCPAEENPKIRPIELLSSRVTIERERWAAPRSVPFGWDKIRKCIPSADPDNQMHVKALAGMLVMYETMAWPDQVFGHYQGGVCHALPARWRDLQPMSDGFGHLHLQPLKQGESGRSVMLSPLTMEWIKRAFAFGGVKRPR